MTGTKSIETEGRKQRPIENTGKENRSSIPPTENDKPRDWLITSLLNVPGT